MSCTRCGYLGDACKCGESTASCVQLDLFGMRITTQKGMVNIDNKEIAYGNIRKMYTTGNGQGLQLSEELEPKRGEIISICAEIADRIYNLHDILDA